MNPVFDLFQRLSGHYGPQGWWPLMNRANQAGFDSQGYRNDGSFLPATAQDRCEILVGAILTQNTSWRNVAKVLASLAAANMLNPAAIMATPLTELAMALHSAGYHNQKARKLQIALGATLERGWLLDGATPPSRQELLALWGIGPETADCLLVYIWGQPSFVVDAYTRRLLSRLRIDLHFDPLSAPYDAIREWFQSELHQAGITPDSQGQARLYGDYHALIVRHATARCLTKPKCELCPLFDRCRIASPVPKF